MLDARINQMLDARIIPNVEMVDNAVAINLWLASQCGKMIRTPVNIDATYNWGTLPQIQIQIQIQTQI